MQTVCSPLCTGMDLLQELTQNAERTVWDWEPRRLPKESCTHAKCIAFLELTELIGLKFPFAHARALLESIRKMYKDISLH